MVAASLFMLWNCFNALNCNCFSHSLHYCSQCDSWKVGAYHRSPCR